jgi:hypothetical protein
MMFIDSLSRFNLFINKSSVLCLISISLWCACTATNAAWHDQLAGGGVEVHYVRLAGYGGNNEVNLQNLVAMHEACVRRNRDMGRPVIVQDSASYPELVTAIDLEIYYSSNRTLDVFQSLHYSVDMVSCALEATAAKKLTLRSGAGKCDADLIKKLATGDCDTQAHARALAWKGAKAQSLPSIDLEKVPAHLRAQVLASYQHLQRSNPQGLQATEQLLAANEEKIMLDVRCQVYRHSQLSHEVCIAQPNLNSQQGLNPYPIPASPFNAAIPGVLMYSKSAALNITAQHVRWNLSVSPNVFNLPAGTQLRSLPGPKP